MEQLNKVQIRTAELRAGSANKENRTVDFVISTEARDTYDTVFLMDGWQLERYSRNPIVCYNHRSYGDNPDTIIGTSEVFREGDALIGRVTFEPEDINPLAEKVFRKVLAGTLRMASVGAEVEAARMGVKEAGEDPEVIYFTRSTLREWSIVTIGSNPDALKRNAEELTALRSAVAKDIPVNPEPQNTENREPQTENGNPVKVRALDAFEAQLIVNKNRSVK